MDPLSNPYTPGAGSKPPALTGRDAEIAAFQTLLARIRAGQPEKSLMITGLRGVGKTVLLNTFRDTAEADRFKTGQSEITHETDFKATIARLARRLVLSLNPVERLKDRAWQAAGVLKAFSIKLPDGMQFSIDVEAVRGKADSGNLAEDLSDLFVAIGEAARERKTGVVLLLDEIQFLQKADLEALIAAVHQASQRNLPITIVGAGLPQLPKLAGEAKSYAERLFNFPMIDRLDAAAAAEALERPAREKGVSYEPTATEEILRYTEGYPYFLQEYGKHVWNVARGTSITFANVEEARPLVQAQLDDNLFRVRMGRATPAERRYISAMAALGPGPYQTGDIAAKLGRQSTTVAPLRGQLINKGLVYSPRHGITDFTVPQFDEYVRRSVPLEGNEMST